MKKLAAAVTVLALHSSVSAGDDTAKGEKLFEVQCASCHTVKPELNDIGPSLAGVVGRRAGTAPGYRYTAAMSNSGLTWDIKTLDVFLTSTTQEVPGTSMQITLPDAQARSAIIAYLKGISPTENAAAAPETIRSCHCESSKDAKLD